MRTHCYHLFVEQSLPGTIFVVRSIPLSKSYFGFLVPFLSLSLSLSLNTVGADLTRQQIIESVDESLKRLGTDYIDLLQLHWPGR